MTRLRVPVCAVALAAVSGVALFVARPSAQQPSFRAGVEVVLLDVSVVDEAGFPVADLAPGEFTVTVDGRPRAILSAQFLAHRAPGIDDLLRVESGLRPPDVIESQRVGTGRDVVIAVDEDSLDVGDGLLAKRAIGRFLDQLSPTDRIALVTIPRLPARIGLTSNRLELFDAVSRISTGILRHNGQYRIGMAEAFEIERRDAVTSAEVVQRECIEKLGGISSRNETGTSQEIEVCRATVDIEAKQLAMMGHDRAQRSLDALRRLAELLSSIPRPKTLVLVSGGVPPPVSPTAFSPVATALAAGQVNLYSLYLEKYEFGSTQGQPSPTATEDDALERTGLDNVTALAGGTLMLVTGEFEPHFDRVARELAGAYLLGIDADAADRDGRPHRVEVKVKRPGVSVRSRKQYVIGDSSASTSGSGRGASGGAPTDASGLAALEAGFGPLSYNRILTAARDLESTGDVYVKVKASRVTSAAGRREVAIDVSIDARSVSFVPLDGRRVARLGIGIFCGDSKREVVGQLWQEMSLALKEDSFPKYKDEGVPYSARVPVTGDARYVKVVVYDFRSDLVGSMTAKVK